MVAGGSITSDADNPAQNTKLFDVTRYGRRTLAYRNPTGSVSIWQDDDLVHLDRDTLEEIAETLYIEAHKTP